MDERPLRALGIDGIGLPQAPPGAVHSYWRYPVWIDPASISGGVDFLASRLRELDIPAAPRYIQKPAFETQVFAEQNTFGSSRWPFTLAGAAALIDGLYLRYGLKHGAPPRDQARTLVERYIDDALASAAGNSAA